MSKDCVPKNFIYRITIDFFKSFCGRLITCQLFTQLLLKSMSIILGYNFFNSNNVILILNFLSARNFVTSFFTFFLNYFSHLNEVSKIKPFFVHLLLRFIFFYQKLIVIFYLSCFYLTFFWYLWKIKDISDSSSSFSFLWGIFYTVRNGENCQFPWKDIQRNMSVKFHPTNSIMQKGTKKDKRHKIHYNTVFFKRDMTRMQHRHTVFF